MPERPKYERINDEEQGIKLDNMRPKHAYLDGDDVVAEPPVQSTENTTAPAPLPASSTPPVHYPNEHDDGGYHNNYYSQSQSMYPGGGNPAPVRRDYAPSPVRPTYRNDYPGFGSGNNTPPSTGAYRDNYDTQHYENSREVQGRSRRGELHL